MESSLRRDSGGGGVGGDDGNCFDYDVVVVGGGSGGLAAAKEAARLNQSVVVFDYVKPSTQGTKWGLGGTCVNVGCVPKKLMHYAASMGPILREDAKAFGWKIKNKTATALTSESPRGCGDAAGGHDADHDWSELVRTVQNHVKSLNFSYRAGLTSAKVKYINALATLTGPNTVKYHPKLKTAYDNNASASTLSTTITPIDAGEADGGWITLKARAIIIAVGGRPTMPLPDETPGARELAISSDDIFSLKNPPGKTLVVGASYIALECAGFLKELGYPVTVAVRSILLRGFDRQCSEKVGSMMEAIGVVFKRQVTVQAIKVEQEGSELNQGNVSSASAASAPVQQPQCCRKRVFFSDGTSEVFDTVLYATGRTADTSRLGLEAAHVKIDQSTSKIICDDEEKTSAPSIYAIGDAVQGRPELTPVAIQAGEYLVRRLFNNASNKMNYTGLPTTVFTPFEYSCCGLSEEAALALHGEDNVEVFLFEFQPLELAAAHRHKVQEQQTDEFDVDLPPCCLSKLVCLKAQSKTSSTTPQHDESCAIAPDGDAGDDCLVIGIHYVGPHAGEVMQGFALALQLRPRKSDFDRMVGIHPTNAEAFASMSITRRSGESWLAVGGCGGGKCG